MSDSARLRHSLKIIVMMIAFVASELLLSAQSISFRNDVEPVLAKAGCNAGACHGNANGKAGFKLSLRGESQELDYVALTRDQTGRRINSLEPDRSLILLKPTAQIAHEGGQRFRRESEEYEVLRRWVAEGGLSDAPDVPTLVRLEVSPLEQISIEPQREVQLKVRAIFSDGSKRDVTRRAVYETANNLAAVSAEGLVQASATGETTVIVRFLQCQVPVRIAFVPARPNFRWAAVSPNNFIDEEVFAKLRALRINPSPPCSDEIFIRRCYLDLLGTLPTAEAAKAFVKDRRADKRRRLIDDLLERPEFADFWALKWSDLLRNEERVLDAKGVQAFHHWIRDNIAINKPMDQFVRELITARGSTYANPAANFYRANRDAVTRAEAAAQVFLGTRLQCAQCHNHPFDRWSQDDYFNWAASFARVNYKVVENRRQDKNDQHEFKGEQIVYDARSGEVKNPRTGKPALPAFLGAAGKRNPGGDDMAELARWLTDGNNPFFARTQVNRIWFHLLGRGVVDPVDDFRITNPASHPKLLDRLASDFVEHGFDLRHVIRMIMNSRIYQLDATTNDTNADDESNYSHALIRRLGAEQLLDCQSQVLDVPLTLSGFPDGTRASQLPGARTERKRDQRITPADLFLDVFGKPPRLLSCECERSSETTMGQAFQMISGPTVNEFLAKPENRIAKLLSSGMSDREIVEALYWTALTRGPTAQEQTKSESLFKSAKNRRAALEDLTWALLNSKEFLLRR
jgi:hypothetical protein